MKQVLIPALLPTGHGPLSQQKQLSDMVESTWLGAFLGPRRTLGPPQSQPSCSDFTKTRRQEHGELKPFVKVLWLSHDRGSILMQVSGHQQSGAYPVPYCVPGLSLRAKGSSNQPDSPGGSRQEKSQRKPCSGRWKGFSLSGACQGPPTSRLQIFGKLLSCFTEQKPGVPAGWGDIC